MDAQNKVDFKYYAQKLMHISGFEVVADAKGPTLTSTELSHSLFFVNNSSERQQ